MGTAETGDSQLQQQIQTALSNNRTTSSSAIQVNVTADKIELDGNVKSNKEKKAAERLAKSYAGNRTVDNRITVSSTAGGASGTMNEQPPTSQTPPKK